MHVAIQSTPGNVDRVGLMQRAGQWLGFVRSGEPGPSDPSKALTLPSRARTGRGVNYGEALGLGSVFRCVQVLDTSAKQLAVHGERHGRRITDRVPSLITRPSLDDERDVFVEQSVVSLACTGNGYWLLDYLADNTTVGNATVLNPNDVEIDQDPAGRPIRYHYRGTEYAPRRIKHLKFMRVPGRAKGLGPIQAAQVELRGAIDTADMAGNFFPSSGVPVNGYLTTEQEITPEEAKGIRAGWLGATENREGIPVLGKGADYKSMFLSARDAQWIESRQFDITGAARLFGMPPSIVLAAIEGASRSYANIEQDFIWYTRYTLSAYTVEVENRWSELLPRGVRARFSLDSLLRTDTKTRYEAHQIGLQAGFITVNEVRALEGMPPVPGGDELAPPRPVHLGELTPVRHQEAIHA